MNKYDEIRRYDNPFSTFAETASHEQARGAFYPHGVGFDTGDNLWVAVSTEPAAAQGYTTRLVRFATAGGGNVTASTDVTLTANLHDSNFFTFQPNSGHMWVANDHNNPGGEAAILKFTNTGTYGAPVFNDGNVTVHATLAQINAPRGIAFDTGGNLWVTSAEDKKIVRYNNNAGNIEVTISTSLVAVSSPLAIAFDNTVGDMYVSPLPEETPGEAALYLFKNIGSYATPFFSTAPFLLQSGIAISQMRFKGEELWGSTPFSSPSEIVRLSTGAPSMGPAGFGTIIGTVTYAGALSGYFKLAVSTDIRMDDVQIIPISSGSTGFIIPGVPAPSTYYMLGFLDENGDDMPSGREPLAYYSTGPSPSPAMTVFVDQDATFINADFQIMDLAVATGTITNASVQTGNMRVEAWIGPPNAAEQRFMLVSEPFGPSPSDYTLYFATGADLSIRAYVDANSNYQHDAGEDTDIFGPFAILTPGTTIGADITIAASAGGQALAQAFNIAPPNVSGNQYDVPFLRLLLWTDSGVAQLNTFRIGLKGSAPSGNVYAKVYRDTNQDGFLQPGPDPQLGSYWFSSGFPPSAEVNIGTETINTTTSHFLIAFDLTNVPAGNSIGASIEFPEDFVFGNGAMAVQSGLYPIESSTATVKTNVAANPANGGFGMPTASPIGGGYNTGLNVQTGQNVSIAASGNWDTGVYGSTWAAGIAGQYNGSAPLPGQVLGALIGRIGFNNWFLVSTGTAFTSNYSGDLYLAMNDDNYGDNYGAVSVEFGIQTSTAVRVWTGNFNNDANIPANWAGDQTPLPGEAIRFDGNNSVNWNIFGANVGLLEMATSYTGTIYLQGTQLHVSGDMRMEGGRFDMTSNSTLEVEKRLFVSSNAVFDMGSYNNSLRLSTQGVSVSDNGIFYAGANGGNLRIERLGSQNYEFGVGAGTITITRFGGSGWTYFDGIKQLDLSAQAVVNAFDHAAFGSPQPNPFPVLKLQSGTPVSTTFYNLAFGVNISTNVDASGAAAGSNFLFVDSTGSKFGTPFEYDPYGVVFWSPDGGGTAIASGTLVYTGNQPGNFEVLATTSPTNEPGALYYDYSTAVYTYQFASLPAPNTWYFFAIKDSDGDPGPTGFDARGGYLSSGSLRSEPVYLNNGDNIGGINIQLEDWGAIEGTITNNSDQVGQIIVAAYPDSNPNIFERWEPMPGEGLYTLHTRATDYSYVIAFIDVNGNEEYDTFEASGSVANVTVPQLSSVTAVHMTIAGGGAQAGGTGWVTATSAHPGYIATSGETGLLKLEIWAQGGDLNITAFKFSITGSTPPSSYNLRAYHDVNYNGIFDPMYDNQMSWLDLPGGVSSGTLVFAGPKYVATDSTETFFLAMDLNGQSGIDSLGLAMGASTYIGISQGSMADQPGTYPIVSGNASVSFAVPAYQWLNMPSQGGTGTGFYVASGQTLNITANGQWNINYSETTGPDGKPGTQGYGTILPDAQWGQLLARIGETAGGSWFKVGSSTQITAQSSGELHFGINDFDGDFFNNSGELYVAYSVSGSTQGAIEGTVTYVGGNPTGNLRVRAYKCDAGNDEDNSSCVAQSTYTVAVAAGQTQYPYSLSGLAPGEYYVDGDWSVDPGHYGNTYARFDVPAGSTKTGVNFELSLGVGSIAGNIIYTGVQNFGSFFVGASTVTDFESDVAFIGETTLAGPGAFTISGLLSPNTYYLIAFRDGNNDDEPNGPEPFGVFGNSDGPMRQLDTLFTPIFVDTAAAVTGKDITVLDRAGISGNVYLSTTVYDKIMITVAGHGPVGSPGYVAEAGNRQYINNASSGSSRWYEVGLLRPATDYSIFAFLDANDNGQYDGGEPFGQNNGPFPLYAGDNAYADVTVAGAQPPPQVLNFTGTALSSTAVRWTWSAAPAAISYQLVSAVSGVLQTVAAPATSYIDVLTPNTTSQIRGIRAVNGEGAGPEFQMSGPAIASFASQPSITGFPLIGQSSVTVTWSANSNSAPTVYEVSRATDSGGPFYTISTHTALSALHYGLAPNRQYWYRVTAQNQAFLYGAPSATSPVTTLAASGGSISGTISYAGGQKGQMKLTVHIASNPWSAAVATATLPNAPQQAYFIPDVSAATYFLQAWVDVNGNGIFNTGEDKGTFGGAGIPVAGVENAGNNITLSVDTVAPGLPYGLTTTLSAGKVDLTWQAPTSNANGSTLLDLAGYRVQRTTATAAGYTTLSTNTVFGATNVVSGLSFRDNSPIAGVDNYYRVRAVDYGGNQSQPSGAVSARPSAGGTISGWVSTFTATTGGLRVRLSTSPQRGTYQAQSTISPFSFAGLQDGTYFLRGFIDADNSGNQDAASEPSGTFGGIAEPFPISIINGNVVSSQTVTICDRTAITPGPRVSGGLVNSDCPARDAGPGRYADLYTFRVGGGASGSIAPGSNIHISMFGSFETQLFLLGPEGYVLRQNSDPYGAYLDLSVNQEGLYIIEAASFQRDVIGGATQYYDLDFFVSGGYQGQVIGNTAYSGSKSGQVHLQLYDNPSETNTYPFFVHFVPAVGAFTIPNVPDGTYYLRAFMDVNGNYVRDGSEPKGVYGLSSSSPTAINIYGGVAAQGSLDVTLADVAVGAVQGTVVRSGSKSGTIRVDIGRPRCSDCGDLEVVAFSSISAGAFAGGTSTYFLQFIAPATDYTLLAYVDSNDNRYPDALEAIGSSKPVTVIANSTASISIYVQDPGFGSAGNSTIQGTVSYSGSASTSPVFIGFATDPEFRSFPYITQLASISANGTQYIKSGIVGNTSYYIGSFIDINNNGEPDFEGDYIEPSYGSEDSPIFVPLSSTVVRNYTLEDPPSGRIQGTVTYDSATAVTTLIVETNSPSSQSEGSWRKILISKTAGTTTYAYTLNNLRAASDFQVRAFVDFNNNGMGDFGEPFFERATPVTVSGSSVTPTTGIDLFLRDIQEGGGGANIGSIQGWVDYTGGQFGQVRVQVYTTSTYVGAPRFDMIPSGGASPYYFDFQGVSNGTYYLRAFIDSNYDGILDPAYEANGKINGGGAITVSADAPLQSGFSGTMTDVGTATGGANSISGSVVYKSSTTPAKESSGTVRVTMFQLNQDGTQSPVRISTYAFPSPAGNPTAFSFTVDPGNYFPRAFIDKNGNYLPDVDEPIGSARTDGFYIPGEFAPADFDICDRGPIDTAPGVVTISTLTVADCRSSEREDRPYQKLFSFSGQRGQVMTIDMRATGFYDCYLTLFGPQGRRIDSDDEAGGSGNARIMNVALPTDGVYTLAAQAFAGGVTGAFELSFQSSAGELGSIAGEVTYSGSQGGRVVIGLFNNQSFDAPNAYVDGRDLDGAGPFAFDNLASGASYYIGGFIDANLNHNIDAGEDSAVFGADGIATPIYLRSGQSRTGISFDIQGTTETVGLAGITGIINYNGTLQGTLRIEFWGDATFSGRPVAVRAIATGAGPYDVSLPGGQPYFIRGFLDADGDFMPDPDEPKGEYGTGFAEPVYVPESGTVQDIDFELFEPGQREGQSGIAGEGTATLSISSVSPGNFISSITAHVVIGPAGINTGGVVAVGVPPGFPFPSISSDTWNPPGFINVPVIDNNPLGAAVALAVEQPPGAPGLVARVISGTLNAGATVQFQMHEVNVPCWLPDGRLEFFFATGSEGSTPPVPLFGGVPALTKGTPAASMFQFKDTYFTLTANTTGQATLQASGNCGGGGTAGGALASVQTSTDVFLQAKSYDYTTGNFSNDSTLQFSLISTGSFSSSLAVPFAVGMTSRTVYVKATSAGEKNIEMLSYLSGMYGSYMYAPVTVHAGNILSEVLVATTPFSVGKTSVTITPNGDRIADQAFINFRLTEQIGWQVMISSIPYKTGVDPNPIFQTWGWGQPTPGQILWDGRYSPWINNGNRVPSGSYYVRVDLGGVRDDSLRIDVQSTQLAGKIVDVGVAPNVPLAGVRINIYGPYGGGYQETDSLGGYVFPGLAAGDYKMNFEKFGYLIGNATITLNSSSVVQAGFKSQFGNITLSTTSAGKLNVGMKRAPALLVVPTISSTQSFESWGGLQVHNASFTRVFHGPLRLKAGTTTFDDGGQWDPTVQRFIEKTQIRFELQSDTYTIRAYLPGFEEISTTTFMGTSGQRTVTLAPFTQRGVIIASVTLPSNPGGVFISVNARSSSTAVQLNEGFGGEYLAPTVTQATIPVQGLQTGYYRVTANAPGYNRVEVASVLATTGTTVSIDMPDFADPNAGNVITGSVTVYGNTTGFNNIEPGVKLRVHVNAWAPGSQSFGSTNVVVAAGNPSSPKTPFVITGLVPGATYQVFAQLEYNGDVEGFESPGGFPKQVYINQALTRNAEGTLDFGFTATDGRINGSIVLPTGKGDFDNIAFFGKVVESVRPENVGRNIGQDVPSAAGLPGFACHIGGVHFSTKAADCTAGAVNTASFTVTGLNTETYEVSFYYATNGKSVKSRLPVVNHATTTASVDLRILDVRSSTYTISGSIINKINNTSFDTNQEIAQNAPHVPLRDVFGSLISLSQVGVAVSTASTARVIAIRQDYADYGVAISTTFDRVKHRVGFMHLGGSFTITNVEAGNYLVRTEDLRRCATCTIAVPRQSIRVVVTTFSRTGQDITLSDGYDVSGSIALANSIVDKSLFRLTVYNSRQEVVRSTAVSIGNAATGATANSANYTFGNLPSGQFYTLVVVDSSATAKYVGRPIKFPNPGLSPNGLQAALSGQNVTMQQAAYVTGKLKDEATGELIRAANATTLPPNFKISARANPWIEGGYVVAAASVSNRPIRGDGTFLVGPLYPETPYDVRLDQDKWDIAYLAQGSQNYSPVLIGGLKLRAGETKDQGTIGLNQGSSIKGRIVDVASTSTALGNIKVTAKPSFGALQLNVQTYTDPNGAFTLWVSTFVSPVYDLAIAPRGGNTAASGKVYKTLDLPSVAVTTNPINACAISTATICLTELLGSVTSQVRTSDGGVLSYPFGERKGFPAAAVFMQRRGILPKANPLGDIAAVTEGDGAFEILGLSTGTYDLKAVSLGYSVFTATVTVNVGDFAISAGGVQLSSITLTRGAQVAGRILLPDGSAPSTDEVTGVAAADRTFTRFVVGALETDENARTVSGYTITGFETGVTYDVVILTGEGANVVAPAEGQGVSFTAAESTATKTINLTFGRVAPECTATSKHIGNFQFQIKFDCTEPLRNETTVDSDLDTIVAKATTTTRGKDYDGIEVPITDPDPNNQGTLLGSDKQFANGRKQITAIYRAEDGADNVAFTSDDEKIFSLRLTGTFNVTDPTTGGEFTIDKVFDFSTRLASAKSENVSNMRGGQVKLEPTDEDRARGQDEKFSVNVPPGGMKKCQPGDTDAAGAACYDAGLGEDTTLNVQIEVRKSTVSVDDAESGTTSGQGLAGLSAADISPELMRARELAAAATVAKTELNPLSAFYAIFLPQNIAHQLGKPADITLSYDLSQTTATAEELNVYYFDTTLGKYQREDTNRRTDSNNNTITVTVDHFSTFVVSDSSPVLTGANPFGGEEIRVHNFPNPFDCNRKTKNTNSLVAGGALTFDGTMIRYSLPAGAAADLKVKIYNIAGEVVRELSQGTLSGGQTYYTPWSCTNQSGKTVASGVYIGQIQWGDKSQFFKMAVIKGSGL
ncbi:MAG: hypothetical protein ABIJ96_11090 [Elusimicrobiota bacterium]